MGLFQKRQKKEKSPTYTVTYVAESQWRVLLQRHGSVWPRVLPYCLANTTFMALLHIGFVHDINLTYTGTGHSYLSIIVGFLMVDRVSRSLNRYNEAREYLEMMNKSCRQLIHTACIYSNSDVRDSAKQWRSELAFRVITMLKASMAVMNQPSTGTDLTDIPEVNMAVLEDLEINVPVPTAQWLHAEDIADIEKNLRVPQRLSYMVRKCIRSQEGKVKPTVPVVAEGDLYNFLNTFMDGYYGVHKLQTTPVPFPLIQMGITFAFFFIVTLPCSLLVGTDGSIKEAFFDCLIVFISTFGFVGLELVGAELDDPFGDDDNDFNNQILGEMAVRDVYLTLLDVDGEEWANKFRNRVDFNSQTNKNSSKKSNVPSENTYLMHADNAAKV